jgi:hypothetical protein
MDGIATLGFDLGQIDHYLPSSIKNPQGHRPAATSTKRSTASTEVRKRHAIFRGRR